MLISVNAILLYRDLNLDIYLIYIDDSWLSFILYLKIGISEYFIHIKKIFKFYSYKVNIEILIKIEGFY